MTLTPTHTLFAVAGVLGIFGEVVFTALQGLWRTRSLRLMGFSFIWMFPIYGSIAVLFPPLHQVIAGWPMVMRGLSYMTAIYAVEYVSGAVLKFVLRQHVWEYHGRWQLHGHIRLAHAPVWFVVGLIVEKYFDHAVALSLWLYQHFS